MKVIDDFRPVGDFLNSTYIVPGKLVGCQIAISVRGNQVYFESLGLMDRERMTSMRDDAIFRIYSMSKPITSVALMMLVEGGLVELDDPVSKYIPEWKGHRVWVSGESDQMATEPPHRLVTVRDMLSHTGGITYGISLEGYGSPRDRHPVTSEYVRHAIKATGGDDLQTFAKKLGKVPLRYQPGERWMYSYSTDVCAALVEIISGTSFDQFLEHEIFFPLGMSDTGFQIPKEKLPRFAANYQFNPKGPPTLFDDPHNSPFAHKPALCSGGGGLLSTTHDYMRFCEMLRSGGHLNGHRLLSSKTVSLMHKNQIKSGKDLASSAIGLFAETRFSGVGFGLGFAFPIDKVAAKSPVDTDWYWGGAASTMFWVDDKHDLSVVFMSQLVPSSTYDIRSQLKNLIYTEHY